MWLARKGTWLFVALSLGLSGVPSARTDMIATIESDTETPFGTYHPVHVAVSPQLVPISVASDFGNVCNFAEQNPGFTARDSTLLFQNHFTVKWSKIYYSDGYVSRQGAPMHMHYIYNDATHYDTPIFVTADAVLHTYHVMFDLALAQIEQEKLRLILDDLIDGLIGEMNVTYAASTVDSAQEAALTALGYLWVAKSLNAAETVTLPDEVAAVVSQELTLIEAHGGFVESPLLAPTQMDYSQFVPRGHYTKTEELKRYFKSMMWLGLASFDSEQEKQTLAALMLTQALYRSEYGLVGLWDAIYEPTVFFVGSSDDPNVRDYITVGETVYGEGFTGLDPESLLAGISDVQPALEALADARIPVYDAGGGETQGFRLMGQRYIPDSYMFASLVSPQIMGEREFPLGLDAMAVLGSDRASELLDEVYEQTQYDGYSEKMADLKVEFESLPSEDWAFNLYMNWLYTLMPMLNDKGDGYPWYMRTEAWRDRELIAALGSWAELRHDTILYAKQSGGATCDPPGPPHSYVEPNPDLYARLLALVRYTQEGLAGRDLLTDAFDEKLSLFDELLAFLLDISVKELENAPITDAEYEDLYSFGDVMETLVTPPAEVADWGSDPSMAVIADVHTGITSGQVLEEAVGYPLDIWVIVGSGDDIRLTRGAVFSYYEFTWPMNDRLTDERWRLMVRNMDNPDMPEWVASIMDIDGPRLQYTDEPSRSIWSHEFDPTAIDRTDDGLPTKLVLHPNRPNPFNPETFIRFELPALTHVRVDIYDASGRHVRTLVNDQYPAGDHTVSWRGRDNLGRDLASGVYLLRLTAGDAVKTQRMMLLR